MVFKINVGVKGKTYKFETDSEDLVGKKIGDSILGSDISADLKDYELKITGTSDKAGFPGFPSAKGPALRKVLFTKGKFFKKVAHKGLRKKKTVRGNEISFNTVQINCSVVKEGSKKLEEIFKKEEAQAPTA